jgi:hypothetical protein
MCEPGRIADEDSAEPAWLPQLGAVPGGNAPLGVCPFGPNDTTGADSSGTDTQPQPFQISLSIRHRPGPAGRLVRYGFTGISRPRQRGHGPACPLLPQVQGHDCVSTNALALK